MSTFFEGYGGRVVKSPAESEAYADLLEEVPIVAKAMAGTYDEEGKCLTPAGTLMFFFDSGVLKFCISPKYGSKVCFGVVQHPLHSLHGVEAALSEGKFEWKDQKQGRRS